MTPSRNDRDARRARMVQQENCVALIVLYLKKMMGKNPSDDELKDFIARHGRLFRAVMDADVEEVNAILNGEEVE